MHASRPDPEQPDPPARQSRHRRDELIDATDPSSLAPLNTAGSAPVKVAFYGVTYEHLIDFAGIGAHNPQQHLEQQKTNVMDMVRRSGAHLVAEFTDTRKAADILRHRPGLTYLLRHLAPTGLIDAVVIDLESASFRPGEVAELTKILRGHDIGLWAPRLGPIDLANPVHALFLRICF
ncbi:hypothetical protein [Actinomadura rupiterrae]|uniref:hypothetical protein n=1 Tax=Actinomadura rupiterrae TaxID=559627 RepID=UPI0020A5406F|nr:hypothetical protein [Actinomadura rupiterrae]MCP2342933.1 hypothetical protein [Actinomadura rupiterrae]